jgi:hypothetical protein
MFRLLRGRGDAEWLAGARGGGVWNMAVCHARFVGVLGVRLYRGCCCLLLVRCWWLELILVIKRPKDPLSRRGRGKGGVLRHLHMR